MTIMATIPCIPSCFLFRILLSSLSYCVNPCYHPKLLSTLRTMLLGYVILHLCTDSPKSWLRFRILREVVGADAPALRQAADDALWHVWHQTQDRPTGLHILTVPGLEVCSEFRRSCYIGACASKRDRMAQRASPS